MVIDIFLLSVFTNYMIPSGEDLSSLEQNTTEYNIQLARFGSARLQGKVFFINGPIPSLSFCLFSSFSQYGVKFSTQLETKLKKHRCCAWNSNQWPQD